MFTAFAELVAWAIHCRGVCWLLHYLDDFLLFGAPGTLEVASAAAVATEVLANAGIPVAAHKTEGPSTAVTFLGIMVDTILFQLRLPPEKVTLLKTLVEELSRRRSCTRRELESFVGHLDVLGIFVRQLF